MLKADVAFALLICGKEFFEAPSGHGRQCETTKVSCAAHDGPEEKNAFETCESG